MHSFEMLFQNAIGFERTVRATWMWTREKSRRPYVMSLLQMFRAHSLRCELAVTHVTLVHYVRHRMLGRNMVPKPPWRELLVTKRALPRVCDDMSRRGYAPLATELVPFTFLLRVTRPDAVVQMGKALEDRLGPRDKVALQSRLQFGTALSISEECPARKPLR